MAVNENGKLPDLCQSCMNKVDIKEDYDDKDSILVEYCKEFVSSIPKSVSDNDFCSRYENKSTLIDYFQLFTDSLTLPKGETIAFKLPSERILNAYYYGNIDMYRNEWRNFLSHLTKSTKNDPNSLKLVESLSSEIDALNAKINQQRDEISNSIKEVDDKFKELRNQIGEDRLKEVIGSFLVNFQKPSILDFKTLTNDLTSCKIEIKEIVKILGKLEGNSSHLDIRLKSVEDKIAITKNVYWIASLVITVIITIFIAGISGWIFNINFP